MRSFSLQTLKILSVFVEDPSKEWYGTELMDATVLSSGTLYPILEGLLQRGWIEDEWEDIDAKVEGRRPRRYYRITMLGKKEAVRVLNAEIQPIVKRLGWLTIGVRANG